MHANFASILGSMFKRFLLSFGCENGAKMDTKFNVFWHWFLIPFFDVSGWCLLVFLKIFASCYDVIFDAEHCVFLYCFDFGFC